MRYLPWNPAHSFRNKGYSCFECDQKLRTTPGGLSRDGKRAICQACYAKYQSEKP